MRARIGILTLTLGVLAMLESPQLAAAEEVATANFPVGAEVLVGTDSSNSQVVVGNVSKVLGANRYEVRFRNVTATGVALEQRVLSGAALAQLNTSTAPEPGLLSGLRNIVHDPSDAVFQQYVRRIDALAAGTVLGASPSDRAAAQHNLIDKVLAEQAALVKSTRPFNQKIRLLYDNRPQRTLGDILKAGVGDTFDASTLLWSALNESAAFARAGMKVQLLRTLTPVNFEEMVLRVTYADGKSELVDPVWTPPRQPITEGAWPQQQETTLSTQGSRKIIGVVGRLKVSAPVTALKVAAQQTFPVPPRQVAAQQTSPVLPWQVEMRAAVLAAGGAARARVPGTLPPPPAKRPSLSSVARKLSLAFTAKLRAAQKTLTMVRTRGTGR